MLKTYEVEVYATETRKYIQTVKAFNKDRARTLAYRQLDANNWTCENKGQGGNCTDAEEFYIVKEIED